MYGNLWFYGILSTTGTFINDVTTSLQTTNDATTASFTTNILTTSSITSSRVTTALPSLTTSFATGDEQVGDSTSAGVIAGSVVGKQNICLVSIKLGAVVGVALVLTVIAMLFLRKRKNSTAMVTINEVEGQKVIKELLIQNKIGEGNFGEGLSRFVEVNNSVLGNNRHNFSGCKEAKRSCKQGIPKRISSLKVIFRLSFNGFQQSRNPS